MFRLIKFLLALPLRLFGWGRGIPRSRLGWAVFGLAAVAGVHGYVMPEWLQRAVAAVTGSPLAATATAPHADPAADIASPAGFRGGTAAGLSPGLFAAFAETGLSEERLARLPDSPPPLADKPADQPWRTLSRVLDGDTVVVDNRTVRLIGVDSPESGDTDRLRAELRRLGPDAAADDMLALGRAAAAFTRRVAEGKRCWLEYDGPTTDQHGHILAYVHLEDGTNLNEAVLYNGYAKVHLNASFRYYKRYCFLQHEARRLGHGLWSRTR